MAILLKPVDNKEAVEWAMERGIDLPEDFYDELWINGVRPYSFTVSNVASLDQIGVVFESLNKSMAEGITFREWKKKVLEEAPSVIELPKGRLETVFRNSTQSSYNSGRWERQQRNKEARPILMYDAINDHRVRPEHSAMDGFQAPADDPVWNEWYPQNGHNCRCSVIALTERQAINRGYDPASHSVPEIEGKKVHPDKGWDHNSARDRQEVLKDRLNSSMAQAKQPVKEAMQRRVASHV